MKSAPPRSGESAASAESQNNSVAPLSYTIGMQYHGCVVFLAGALLGQHMSALEQCSVEIEKLDVPAVVIDFFGVRVADVPGCHGFAQLRDWIVDKRIALMLCSVRPDVLAIFLRAGVPLRAIAGDSTCALRTLSFRRIRRAG